MSESDLGTSSKPSKVGPDYFSFYTREVEKLVSPDEDFLPYSNEKDINAPIHLKGGASNIGSGGSFSQGIGAEVSEFKKERLKSLLQQSVVSLSSEVDDMLNPVLAIRQLQSQLKLQKSQKKNSVAQCGGDARNQRKRKFKVSSSSSSESDNEVRDANMISNANKSCSFCHTTTTPMWRTGPEKFQYLCNACGIEKKKLSKLGDKRNTESFRASNIGDNTQSKEVDDDMQFLLKTNPASVESSIKKYSDELFVTLDHMERQLEEILDLSQSCNRLMTLNEKQQLQKMIQKLPPKILDRVAEIIQRKKSLPKHGSNTILVDLEEEDNVTLWRLYIYAKTVENAQKALEMSEKAKITEDGVQPGN